MAGTEVTELNEEPSARGSRTEDVVLETGSMAWERMKMQRLDSGKRDSSHDVTFCLRSPTPPATQPTPPQCELLAPVCLPHGRRRRKGPRLSRSTGWAEARGRKGEQWRRCGRWRGEAKRRGIRRR